MDIIQVGRKCKVQVHPESGSAIEFGNEVVGVVKGRDQIAVEPDSTLKDMYPDNSRLNVILVEDECGANIHVPERDVIKIVCE